jgi:rubrerythrin
MAHDIDFSSLTVRDALDLAVFIEQEAKERYEDFAAQMETHHTPEAARFFRHMAANELKHAEKITDKRTARFGDEPVTVDRNMLFDVEAPEFDQARAFMKVRQALEVALDSETKAFEFYEGALDAVEDDDLQELFAWLRDEEVAHQRMVRELMERVGEDGPFDPDDFVDAPTGQ